MTTYAAERRRTLDARYRKQYNLKQLRGEPTSLVPADRAQQHIQALVDLGWSCVAIHQTAGEAVSDTTVVNILNGRHQTIERNTINAILAVPYTVAVLPLVDDTAKVPALGAQRRIRALLRLGWTHPVLRQRAGVDTSHLARGTYPQILARKWRAADDVFRELCLTPGPSTATRDRAIKLGYAPPLAFDDIDDPDATPNLGIVKKTTRGRVVTRTGLIEDAEWLAADDMNLTNVLERLGTSRENFYQACKRSDRLDLFAKLARRDPTGEISAAVRATKRGAA